VCVSESRAWADEEVRFRVSGVGCRVQGLGSTDEEVEQGVGDHADEEEDIVRHELDACQRKQICGLGFRRRVQFSVVLGFSLA